MKRKIPFESNWNCTGLRDHLTIHGSTMNSKRSGDDDLVAAIQATDNPPRTDDVPMAASEEDGILPPVSLLDTMRLMTIAGFRKDLSAENVEEHSDEAALAEHGQLSLTAHFAFRVIPDV